MKKKITALFLLLIGLGVTNVYADKEYKFTINNTLENKEITYTWENTIDNFNFEMVSPSKVRYTLTNYEDIYYEGNNTIRIRFPELEQGTWKVFFRGESNPVGIKNTIKDYIPDTTEPSEFKEPDVSSKTSEEENGVIIIGGFTETETETEEVKETEEPKDNVKEETKTEEVETETETEPETEEVEVDTKEASDEDIAKRKEILKSERDSAKTIQKETLQNYGKKTIKEDLEEDTQSEDSEEEISENTEVLLNFDDVQDVEETEDAETEDTQKVIFMGGEETQTVNVDENSLVTGTDDLNIVNINADEERAKEKARQERIAANKTRNNILMVLPLFATLILAILDVLFEIKRKKTVGMVDYTLKNFDIYVDRSEESFYRKDEFATDEEVQDIPTKKGFSLFNKKKNVEPELVEEVDTIPVISNPFDAYEENQTEDINTDVNTIQNNEVSNSFEIDEDEDEFNAYRPPVPNANINSEVVQPPKSTNPKDSFLDFSDTKEEPKKKNLFGGDDISFKKTKTESNDTFNWED